jgi:hypothetical protein
MILISTQTFRQTFSYIFSYKKIDQTLFLQGLVWPSFSAEVVRHLAHIWHHTTVCGKENLCDQEGCKKLLVSGPMQLLIDVETFLFPLGFALHN